MISAGRQGQSRAVFTEVEKRHYDIKHIEQTIIELHQLFMDMQMMVEQQGDTLQRVEVNAETTAVQLEEGNKHLNRAILLAKSTRTVRITSYAYTFLILFNYRKSFVVCLYVSVFVS